MALAPQLACLKYKDAGAEGVAVNLFDTSRFTTRLGDQVVALEQKTEFPLKGASVLTFSLEKPATFGFKLRAPAWAEPLKLRVEGEANELAAPRGDWAVIAPRQWKNGDRVTVSFNLSGRLVMGEHGNKGLAALLWGPFVLACDSNLNKGLPALAQLALGPDPAKAAQDIRPQEAPFPPPPAGGAKGEGTRMTFDMPVRTAADAQPKAAKFAPFAEAGMDGGRYQVWMRLEPGPVSSSLFGGGKESRSRPGNVEGSINDGDPESLVVTFGGESAGEDWFAVEADKAVNIGRVVFMHGRCFHDGGWFDAAAGKPKVQVLREKGGQWETVGTLDDYPATTATDKRGLKDGQAFALKLKEQVRAVGLRVLGKPASGDDPKNGFSSCAELQAFAE
jgi:hypothetical protein